LQAALCLITGSNAFGLDPADKGSPQRDYQKRFADLFNYATFH
jgi:hypothetical protein